MFSHMCGYTTYERVPHVVCLPVHLENADWITFTEGQEEQALQTSISMLQRYFCRPKREPFLCCKYFEYFERFMVAKTCPQTVRPYFPDLFPGVSAPPPAGGMAVQPALDEAPSSRQAFVYEQQRGERPVCRLEMKFPKQKEVFYLRHILLNYAKNSFLDCRVHNGRTYRSYEEALVATGYFAAAGEADHVLEELVQLRYTAAQLRFAFLVLLDQDANPVTLYKRFEKQLMADFLDRGVSITSARISVQTLLNLSSHSVGKSFLLESSDPAICSHGECQRPPLPTTSPLQARVQAKTLFKALAKDASQTKAAEAIVASIRRNEDAYFFVHGPAGSGKSTLAKYVTFITFGEAKQIVNMATTGQAALQLPFGATAHSVCKIPVSDEDVLTCTLSLDSAAAAKLAYASVLQWDEWPNAKKSAWECVLKLLTKIKEHYSALWKPKVIVCYGDFRQIPPVVKGSPHHGWPKMANEL